jgi:hypothetical protein
MRELLWPLYGVGILMTWYENRWIVGAWPSDRPMWFSPATQAKFWIATLVVCFGSLVGLWYYDGLPNAAIAFVAYFVFQKVSFRIYFTREVQMWAERFSSHDMEEAKSRNEQADPSAIMQKALELAKITVVRNMKGGGF